MKTLNTLKQLSLAALLSIAAACTPSPSINNTKMDTPTMINHLDTYPVCLGRVTVQIPKDFKINESSTHDMYNGFEITSKPMSLNDFNAFIEKQIAKYKSQLQDDGGSMFKQNYTLGKPNSIAIESYHVKFNKEATVLEGYYWLNGKLYIFNTNPLRSKYAEAVVRLKDSINRFQFRAENQMPTTTGVCIANGFFADDGTTGAYPEMSRYFESKSVKDVSIYIKTRHSYETDTGEETLSASANRFTGLTAKIAATAMGIGIHGIRKNSRTVGNLQGYEFIYNMNYKGNRGYENATWQYISKTPNSPFSPFIELEISNSDEEDESVSLLNEKETLTLFDTTVDSVKVIH